MTPLEKKIMGSILAGVLAGVLIGLIASRGFGPPVIGAICALGVGGLVFRNWGRVPLLPPRP